MTILLEKKNYFARNKDHFARNKDYFARKNDYFVRNKDNFARHNNGYINYFVCVISSTFFHSIPASCFGQEIFALNLNKELCSLYFQ